MRRWVCYVLVLLVAISVVVEAQQQENIQVVRVSETLYVPWQPRPTAAGAAPAANKGALGTGQNKTPAAPERKAAHYSTTLKPLLTYLIHHPVKATYRYILPFALHSIVYALKSCLFAVVFGFNRVLLPCITPAKHIFTMIVVGPFQRFVDLVLAWTPVWTFLGFALVSGSCMGAMAGWLTRSDKPSKDEWVDLVNSQTARSRFPASVASAGRKLIQDTTSSEEGAGSSFGMGARLEKGTTTSSSIRSRRKSSSLASSASRKGKGRLIEGDSSNDDDVFDDTEEDDTATLRPSSMMGSSAGMLSHLRFGESDVEGADDY